MQSDCAPLQSEQTLGKNLLRSLIGLETQNTKMTSSSDKQLKKELAILSTIYKRCRSQKLSTLINWYHIVDGGVAPDGTQIFNKAIQTMIGFEID